MRNLKKHKTNIDETFEKGYICVACCLCEYAWLGYAKLTTILTVMGTSRNNHCRFHNLIANATPQQ